jgi:hypothetical protein
MSVDGEQSDIRELDRRNGDGFEVTLLWSSRTGNVFVAVEDARTGESFHFAVDPSDALDAFRHPYAYSRQGSHPATVQPERSAVPARRHE